MSSKTCITSIGTHSLQLSSQFLFDDLVKDNLVARVSFRLGVDILSSFMPYLFTCQIKLLKAL